MTTQEEFDMQCREHVRRIAEELDDIANGCDTMVCKNCGFTTPEEECPECGEETEEMTMWNYFDDCLDVKYTVDSQFRYVGARIMVACGGPNIYVDTFNEEVELYWGGTHEKWSLRRDTVIAIDEVFEEYAEMSRCA